MHLRLKVDVAGVACWVVYWPMLRFDLMVCDTDKQNYGSWTSNHLTMSSAREGEAIMLLIATHTAVRTFLDVPFRQESKS